MTCQPMSLLNINCDIIWKKLKDVLIAARKYLQSQRSAVTAAAGLRRK